MIWGIVEGEIQFTDRLVKMNSWEDIHEREHRNYRVGRKGRHIREALLQVVERSETRTQEGKKCT